MSKSGAFTHYEGIEVMLDFDGAGSSW